MWQSPAEKAEEDRDFAPGKSNRRRAIVLLLVILFTGSILSLAKPVILLLKKSRAQGFARKAEAALLQNDVTKAVDNARAAYLIAPSEPAALRAAARVQASLRDPKALEYWRALLQQGSGTREDQRSYAEACIRAGALEPARSTLQTLLSSEPDNSTNLWLKAQLLVAENKMEDALNAAGLALAKEPANKQYTLFVARLGYGSGKASDAEAARATLGQLALQPDACGLEAAVFLSYQNDSRPLTLDQLADLLEKNPFSQMPHRLLAVKLAIRSRPQARVALIEKLIGGLDPNRHEDREVVAAWLNEQREFLKVLQILPIGMAKERSGFCMAHLDALAGLERWSDVRKTLNEPGLPLPEAVIAVYRARTAAKLNDLVNTAAEWKHALQAAAADKTQLAYLAEYARRCGEYDQAKRFYRTLASLEADSLPVYLRWLELLKLYGTTEELRDLFKLMVDRWPEEIAFQNDRTYLELLLERNIEAAVQSAGKLAQLYPDNLPFQATLALGRLRVGQPAAALESFRNRVWDWNLALPGHRAIYAAVLAANRQFETARAVAGSIRRSQLRPEEWELIPKGLRVD